MRKQLKCLFKCGYFTYLNQISTHYIYYNIFSIVTTINTHSYARYSRKIQ